jgi:hypothetical protein
MITRSSRIALAERHRRLPTPLARSSVLNPKTTAPPLRRSSMIVALACCCVAAFGMTSTHAQQLRPAACADHTVVNGVHHQPTMAEIAAAQADCGVATPVDTAPEFGRAIDEINNTLFGSSRD